MKNALLTLGFVFATLAMAESPLIICGTGDALGGLNLYFDTSTGLGRMDLLPVADDALPKTYDLAMSAESSEALIRGESILMVGRTANSIEFGGAVSDAALLQLAVHMNGFSYDHNATLAEAGTVYSLFCNLSQNTPPRNPNN